MRRLLVLTALALAGTACATRVAFWLRPPATPAELERTLVAAKAAGFTDVLLEGFYHGRTVWPSAVAPMKTSYDALRTTVEVARREGLGVNVWMETLYWRPADRFGVPATPLWRDEWATRTADGRTSLQVSSLGFVDPSEPGVGDVLDAVVREFTRAYPEVGLHLDYLRYPREADFGYAPRTLQEFTRRTGQDARTIRRLDEQGLETPEWREWTRVRADAITALAGRLTGAYRDAGGRGLVSAAVYGANDPLQDWRRWPGLEVAMPMTYFTTSFSILLPLALLNFERGARVWPGVQVGPGYPALADQLARVKSLGYPNVAVFGWTPPR